MLSLCCRAAQEAGYSSADQRHLFSLTIGEKTHGKSKNSLPIELAANVDENKRSFLVMNAKSLKLLVYKRFADH